MEFLLHRFRNLTVLLVVVLGQLLLLAYQVKSSQDIRLIRVWSVTAVTPVAKVLEVVRRHTIGLVEDYFVLINVREENRRLSSELGKMKMENHFLKSELDTAERAQALIAFQARTPSRTVPARIIGTGTGANSRVVYVDQGSGAGIMRGMAVVTPDGIVGKVLDAYPTASQVMLITDPTFRAGVTSQKNRVHGTIEGQGQNKLLVNYVQNEEKVEVGEVFYTSGDDRIFPKGMPVGRATVVRPGKTFKEIYVVPNGFQNGLEEVLIVVQGEHQAIPEHSQTASGEMYMMDPPKPTATPGSQEKSVLSTEADRLREQYKEVGSAQGHEFGEGGPGSRPPNFNLRVEAPKPAVPAAPAAGTTQGTPPVARPSNPVDPTGAVKPQTSGIVPPSVPIPKPTTENPQTNPLGSPAAAKPKPQVTGSQANGSVQPPIVRPKPTAEIIETNPLAPPAAAKPKPQATGSQANGLVQPPVSRPKPAAEGSETNPPGEAEAVTGSQPNGLVQPPVSRPKPAAETSKRTRPLPRRRSRSRR